MSIVRCSGIYFGTRQSRCLHSLMLGAHLQGTVSRGRARLSGRTVLVGLNVGSLLAISSHFPRGTACCRYAIAAKQCASIDGREKAGPQTWSSSIALATMRRVGEG